MIPWGAVKYLIGDAMYGGRVTDKFDRRLIATMILDFCNFETPEVGYKFSPSGVYKSIESGGEGVTAAVPVVARVAQHAEVIALSVSS